MPHPESDEEKIRWYLLALYVTDAIDCLGADQKLKLAHVAEQWGGEASWRKVVEEDHHVDRKMIEGIYNFATRKRSHGDCLIFILRGLGCPYPEARVRDVIGNEENE